MVVAEVLSVALYIASVLVLKSYFDFTYVITMEFAWKVSLVTLVSCFPVTLAKYIRRKLRPPIYEKLID